MACNDYVQYAPVLRVYRYTKDTSSYVPLPSPICFQSMVESNGLFEQVVDFGVTGSPKYVPCFFGNIMEASVTQEREHQAVSFDVELPYEYNDFTVSNFFGREVEVIVPIIETYGDNTIVYPRNFLQSYLYRLDVIRGGVSALDTLIETYYTTPNSTNLDAINNYIDTNSKVGYWGYLVEPKISRRYSSTMDFKFVGEVYKLQTNMNLSYPEEAMYNFLLKHTTLKNFFFKSVVQDAAASGVYLPVYDGWSISAVILSAMYYAGLFPLVVGATGLENDKVFLTRESYNTDYQRYKFQYTVDDSENTAVSTVLIISNDLDSKFIPCSAIYPEYNEILQGGFSYQTNPFSMVQDILDELSDIVGFTYYFENSLSSNSGALIVEVNDTSAVSVNVSPLTLTGEDVAEIDVVTTSEDVRNSITVIGQGIGLANSVVCEVVPDETSIEIFGRQQMVIESPLILTVAQAQGIADNLLKAFAYNAGNLSISMPISLNDNEVQINRKLSFSAGVGASGRELDGITNLYISNIDYIVTRREQGEMSIEATPLTDRTVVNIPGGFDNLSIVNNEDIFNKGMTHMQYKETPKSSIVGITTTPLDLYSDSESFTKLDVEGMSTSKVDIFTYYKNITRNIYNASDVGENTYTIKFYIYDSGTETTSLEKELTVTKNLGDAPTNVVIYAVGKSHCSGFENLGVCDVGMILDSLTFYIKCGNNDAEIIQSYVYTEGNNSISSYHGRYLAKVESSGGTSQLVDMNFRYLEYDIGADPSMALTFKLMPDVEEVEYPGLVEVGFLMVASSTVGEDDDGVPFAGVTVSDSTLSVNDEFDPFHSIGNILTSIYNMKDNGFMIDPDGNLVTHGCLDNIVTVAYDEAVSSLKNSINTAFVPYSDVNRTDADVGWANLLFKPLVQTDSVSLTYANVMSVIPVIKITVNDVVRLYPQNDVFILHGKLPEDYTDRFTLDNTVIHKLISSVGTVNTSNKATSVQYYKLNSTDTVTGNKLHNLNLNDVNATMIFGYKTNYPVNLRLGVGNPINIDKVSVPLYYKDTNRFSKETYWYGGNFANSSEFYFNIGLNKYDTSNTAMKTREINVLSSFPDMIEFGYNLYNEVCTAWIGGLTNHPRNDSYPDKIPVCALVDPFYALSLDTLIDKDISKFVKYYGVYGLGTVAEDKVKNPAFYAENVFHTKDGSVYDITQQSVPYWFCLDYISPDNIPE